MRAPAAAWYRELVVVHEGARTPAAAAVAAVKAKEIMFATS
jgi:hypothetical protein